MYDKDKMKEMFVELAKANESDPEVLERLLMIQKFWARGMYSYENVEDEVRASVESSLFSKEFNKFLVSYYTNNILREKY